MMYKLKWTNILFHSCTQATKVFVPTAIKNCAKKGNPTIHWISAVVDTSQDHNGYFKWNNLLRNFCRALVVAQLVERSLLIPEVRGLNPVISKNLYITVTVNCIKKTKIKKKKKFLYPLSELDNMGFNLGIGLTTSCYTWKNVTVGMMDTWMLLAGVSVQKHWWPHYSH